MNLNRLRAQARQKRDGAIALARSEYKAAISRIASIERQSVYKGRGVQSVTKAVDEVLPAGTFTVDDILAKLESLAPDRFWPRKQIVNHLFTLRARGVVHRLRRPTTGQAALYSTTATPRDETRLMDLVARVVCDRPLRLTEITVRVREAGYSGRMTPKVLRGWIATQMRRSGRFRCDGGRWWLSNRPQ